MKRRVFLSTASTAPFLLSGCTSSNNDSENTPQNTAPATESDSGDSTIDTESVESTTRTETERPTETTPEYDAIIEYTTYVQENPKGEYDLPDPVYEDWDWLVLDFEVVEGQLDMEDVWFNGLFETMERYYTVSKQTDEAKNGIEPRGAIREGGRGLTLHEYPPAPRTDPLGPMFSALDSQIGGEGVGTDGPSDLYPSVTVEYSVSTTQNPEVLPDNVEAEQGNTWAVVNLKVKEGVLNMEDVWFRSQLLTGSRVYDVDHDSQFADRGVRSRGLVKQGFSANVLYQIGENESVQEWGYQDDNRQNVMILRE